MAEPTTASPPSTAASLPPVDGGGSGGNNERATPDDFLAGGGRGSGDSPPPPDRKQQPSGGGGNPNPNNSNSRRDPRYGLGSGGNPMKFQFYTPGGESSTDTNSSANSNTNWGSNPKADQGGGGSATPGRGGAQVVGNNLKKIQQQQQQQSNKQQNQGGNGGPGKGGTGGPGKTKGIDPPEKELPTGMTSAEESARKARARLIQLQHRESLNSAGAHHPSMRQVNVAAASAQLQQVQQQGRGQPQNQRQGSDSSNSMVEASLSESSRSSKGQRRRAETGSSLGGLESIEASPKPKPESSSSSEDDDDYPLVTMDPIESDDEPVSDHFEEEPTPNTQQQASLNRYGSPVQGRQKDSMSYMKKHPSSAPQRPSHRLPPQQLMQYLHAGGRGSFAGRGGQGGRGMFPLPLDSGPPHNHGSGSKGGSFHGTQHLPRQGYVNQQQSLTQARQQSQHMQQYHDRNAPRRKSEDAMHGLYSDGIDILEKAAREARERDEVDTLTDGINYLKSLEREMEKKGDGLGGSQHGMGSQQHGGPQQHQGQQSYSIHSSPRKGPPPPPPPPPFKGQVVAVPTNRPHRPPPKVSKQVGGLDRARSNSLGDDMEKMAMQVYQQEQEQQQQQQQQGGGGRQGHPGGQPGQGGRIHRPPPPRKQSASNPSTPVATRKRPVITAAAAMDFVMSASARPPPFGYDGEADDREGMSGSGHSIPGNRKDNDQVESDMHKMQSFLNAMMREDGEEAMDVSEARGGIEELDLETSSSGSDGNDTADEDDFERNTSLSMHAEAKFGSKGGQYGSSRYAEDKRGPAESASKLERMTSLEEPRSGGGGYQNMNMSDSNFHVRKKGGRSSGKSVDPPEDEDGHHTDEGHDSDIAPSVLPMRTMNERLYAVETVIPTPTRYHDEYHDDEVDSFDRGMSRLGHDDAPSHALGPRSQRPGGITGVVLDAGDDKAGYPRPKIAERDRFHTQSPSESSSGHSSSTDDRSRDDDDPQSAHDGDRSPGSLDKYSWSADSPDGSTRQATGLMMKLCSHLLPAGIEAGNSSLTSMLLQNKSSTPSDLEWDDDDPDEPGYIVHRLTNSQLISVENAFEKMVAALERTSEKGVRNGQQSTSKNDKNFERDLEEAELVLDREERRYENEKSRTKKPSDAEPSRTDAGLEIQVRDGEVRESVPDFPGIYPPGKGRPGEMECFYLPVITKSQKTGFEPTKDLVLKSGSVFANNYLVQSELGSAAFSTAYRCLDLSSEEDEDGYQDEVCLKVIKNTKDYFDQSLDEIKILQLLKDTGRVQENNIVEMRSFFYHREHLVIVTELLRQNLYEFGKSILESRGPLYFTRLRLSHITRQCLVALRFVHELGLMHCDIKPENILLSSYSRALVKVIDFGSSSFVTDRQSSYIQSRSYRAPEVILGLPYGGKIDMWSLGCVVAEMYTNEVTFQNDSELSMLSRIEAICGPFPRHMIAEGRNSHRIFTDSGLIYEKVAADNGDDDDRSRGSSDDDDDKTVFNVYQPKMTTIAARLGFDEDFMDQPKLSEDDKKRALFVDFVSKLLTIDPDSRPSAAEALKHPWITSSLELTEDDIRYGQ